MGRVLPSVETTGHIGVVNERYQLIIRSALEVSIALAQVYVDLDWVLNRWHRSFVALSSVMVGATQPSPLPYSPYPTILPYAIR